MALQRDAPEGGGDLRELKRKVRDLTISDWVLSGCVLLDAIGDIVLRTRFNKLSSTVNEIISFDWGVSAAIDRIVQDFALLADNQENIVNVLEQIQLFLRNLIT